MKSTKNEPGYLCYAWGESDFPAFRFVPAADDVAQFLCDEWFGEQPETMHPENREQFDYAMRRVRADRDDPDAWDGTDSIVFEFEIGGIKVIRACESLARKEAA